MGLGMASKLLSKSRKAQANVTSQAVKKICDRTVFSEIACLWLQVAQSYGQGESFDIDAVGPPEEPPPDPSLWQQLLAQQQQRRFAEYQSVELREANAEWIPLDEYGGFDPDDW